MSLDNISRDDLPEGFQEVADELGMELAMKLVELLPGATIRVPTMRGKAIRDRNAEIREAKHTLHWSDMKIQRKFGVSETTLRRILKESLVQRRMTE